MKESDAHFQEVLSHFIIPSDKRNLIVNFYRGCRSSNVKPKPAYNTKPKKGKYEVDVKACNVQNDETRDDMIIESEVVDCRVDTLFIVEAQMREDINDRTITVMDVLSGDYESIKIRYQGCLGNMSFFGTP